MTRMIMLEKWNEFTRTFPYDMPQWPFQLIKVAFYTGFLAAVAMKATKEDVAGELGLWEAELLQMKEREHLREMTRH